MSLGIVFKGAEGIVLAADSRVTLNMEKQQPNGKTLILPSTYDNAQKLLRIKNQNYIGVVTYGLGALGNQNPRTAHSFLPEFENELVKNYPSRLSVLEFSQQLSNFFMLQWKGLMPNNYKGQEMTFLVGGFDENEPYGKVYRIEIPSQPIPQEQNPGNKNFGLSWGGQSEFTFRLLKGFDPAVPNIIKNKLSLSDDQTNELVEEIQKQLPTNIPFPFLPLQDCVDLSIFLINSTREMQTWLVGIRGVGGATDVATITREDGFQPIQIKKITGESN